MSTILRALVLLIAVVLPVAVAAQDAQRIAVVDLQRALNEVEEGTNARTQLEADLERRQTEFETAQADLEREATEFRAAMTMMTQEAAMQRYQELEQRAMQLEQQYQQHQVELAQAEAEATDRIAERMVTIVSELAAQRGYTMVVDRSSVVYAASADDLTADLIRVYDERH